MLEGGYSNQLPQLYDRPGERIERGERSKRGNMGDAAMNEDELASTISEVESNTDDPVQVISKKDLLQLEIFENHFIRVTCGKMKVGKLLKVNEIAVESTEKDSDRLIQLLCSTPIEQLQIDSVTHIDNAKEFFKGESRYTIQFRKVADGPLGASVEFVPIPVKGIIGLGLQIQSISTERLKTLLLKIGDIILSVNGVSLLTMDKQKAINTLSGSTNRKLVILRGSPFLEAKSSRLLDPQNNVSWKDKIEEFELKSLRMKAGLKPIMTDPDDSFLEENVDHDLPNLKGEPIPLPETNWKSIRSNYLCKTIYRSKTSYHYNDDNTISQPKYRFTSELKSALAFGQRPYKDLILQSAESKLNILKSE